MLLKNLLKGVEIKKVIGSTDVDIVDIKTNSSHVVLGSLFICISGEKTDGHNFVWQAENYGAVAIITEREVQSTLVQIVVDDSRKAMSILASNFYDNPSDKLKLVGVVGTNGKTTTSFMVYNILKENGFSCGLIGTNGIYYNDTFLENNLTTPDPLYLHKIFSEMIKSGIKYVVMEVSAHAIYLNKMAGLNFEVGIFTNLSQDHLDFFKDMEEYENAKIKFFNQNDCKYIVSNSDNETGIKISNNFPKTITYGIDNPADVFAIDVEEQPSKTKFVINLFDCIFNVTLNMIGRFNIYNALASSCACALLGVKPQRVINSLTNFYGVSGRLEMLKGKDFRIYVDYAHTPDGLKNVLQSLKNTCENRLICLFGCGGNRDVLKRSIMGEVSGQVADFTIITTDNPRFEDPMDIIREIEKGVLKHTKKYIIIQDREQAIKYALEMAKSGDTLLIAGKGCEMYQDVLGIKKPFNDKDIVNEFIRG